MAKKNTERGFTLVELIVVLVILAILAALLIPALTGYIDKARKSQVVAETRALTQAVQTEMSTIYALNDEFQRQKTIGKNLTIASKDGKYGDANGQLDNKLKERYAEIIHLSEVPILEEELESTTGKSSFFAIINKKGAVQWTVYNNGKGYIGIYCGDDGKTDVFKESKVKGYACNGVQREHNKKLNNGLPILHKVPPKRDYGRYFCIMAEKGGTSHGGLTEKLSLFFHAKKQEVNAYGR